MQTTEAAIGLGAILMLVGLIAALAWLITNDDSPRERTATRAGLGVAFLVAVAVGLAEWQLYIGPYHTLGAFLLFPSIPLGGLLALKIGRIVYRKLGGGEEPEKPEAKTTSTGVEQETLAHQGEIWCRLRDLPHFRETVNGDLINLASGDYLRWIDHRGERCIDIKLAGQTGLLGARYETLTRYLAVQRGLARFLAGR